MVHLLRIGGSMQVGDLVTYSWSIFIVIETYCNAPKGSGYGNAVRVKNIKTGKNETFPSDWLEKLCKSET